MSDARPLMMCCVCAATMAGAACQDAALALTVRLPDDAADSGAVLLASVYTPSTPVTCADLAFRDVTQEQLAPALVTSTILDSNSGGVGDVPIAGTKIVVVTGSRDGAPVLEGCGVIDAIDGREALDIQLEHTVRITPAPSMPAQLVVPDRGGMVILVRRTLDNAVAAGHAVRVDLEPAQEPLSVETAATGVATIEVSASAPGPFIARARARLQIGAPVERTGFMAPNSRAGPFSGAAAVDQLQPLVLDGRAAVLAVTDGGTRARLARAPTVAGGDWQEETIVGTSDGAVSLTFVARAVINGMESFLFTDDSDRDAATPPDLVRATPGVGLVVVPLPQRFLDPRAVAAGPCTDPDSAPIAIVAGDGRQLALVDVDGSVVQPPDGAEAISASPVASYCAPNTGVRGLVVLQRGSKLAVAHLPGGLDATAPILPQLANAEQTPGAVAFGEERDADGGLVVARLENVEVRAERKPAADGASIALPGGAIAVGAARLFSATQTRLFALVALVGANGAGDGAPILVVEGDGAVAGLAASLPLPDCAPALTCALVAADTDADGDDELVVVHTRAATDGTVDPPQVQILDLAAP